MAAPAVRRRLSRAAVLAGAACVAAAAGAQPASEAASSFLSGPELAGRLLHNVVRIATTDIGEQGFGLVVATDGAQAYVLTARHVVASRPPLGLEGPERPSERIEVRFCARPEAPPAAASRVTAFEGGADDVALLRVAAPTGYAPDARALTPVGAVQTGSATWVLGFEQRCEAAAGSGAVESVRDAQHNLRARHAGVRGGSSGAPLLVGQGLAGLVTGSDQVMVTALSLEHLRERLLAQGLPWALAEARNIPPTDPAAARIDLAETLNRYLFAVRETHGLLLQPRVARATFKDYVGNYNLAIARFRDARDKYDGTLARHWPPEVLPAWTRLREDLWQVHLSFWQVNEQARTLYETQTVPASVQGRMKELEPALQGLQGDIAQFLRMLGQGSIDDGHTTR